MVRHYGYIEEVDKWLRVILDDGKLFSRFFDHSKMKGVGAAMKITIDYDRETDNLSLWNGRPASEGQDIAEGLVADLDADGNVVGFTLEHAGALLGPALNTAPVDDATRVAAALRTALDRILEPAQS